MNYSLFPLRSVKVESNESVIHIHSGGGEGSAGVKQFILTASGENVIGIYSTVEKSLCSLVYDGPKATLVEPLWPKVISYQIIGYTASLPKNDLL